VKYERKICVFSFGQLFILFQFQLRMTMKTFQQRHLFEFSGYAWKFEKVGKELFDEFSVGRR
jgi:hypothetical protein